MERQKIKLQAAEEIVASIFNMIYNNIIKENGGETFISWCECGDVFNNSDADMPPSPEVLQECERLMHRVAPYVDSLSNALEQYLSPTNTTYIVFREQDGSPDEVLCENVDFRTAYNKFSIESLLAERNGGVVKHNRYSGEKFNFHAEAPFTRERWVVWLCPTEEYYNNLQNRKGLH